MEHVGIMDGIIVLALALKVALIGALVSRRRWRVSSETWKAYAHEADDHCALVVRDYEARLGIACAMLAEKRAALAEIATTITRRPPRRRWLAVSKRVAKIAGAA